jgi:hypothetical protein
MINRMVHCRRQMVMESWSSLSLRSLNMIVSCSVSLKTLLTLKLGSLQLSRNSLMLAGLRCESSGTQLRRSSKSVPHLGAALLSLPMLHTASHVCCWTEWVQRPDAMQDIQEAQSTVTKQRAHLAAAQKSFKSATKEAADKEKEAENLSKQLAALTAGQDDVSGQQGELNVEKETLEKQLLSMKSEWQDISAQVPNLLSCIDSQ